MQKRGRPLHGMIGWVSQWNIEGLMACLMWWCDSTTSKFLHILQELNHALQNPFSIQHPQMCRT